MAQEKTEKKTERQVLTHAGAVLVRVVYDTLTFPDGTGGDIQLLYEVLCSAVKTAAQAHFACRIKEYDLSTDERKRFTVRPTVFRYTCRVMHDREGVLSLLREIEVTREGKALYRRRFAETWDTLQGRLLHPLAFTGRRQLSAAAGSFGTSYPRLRQMPYYTDGSRLFFVSEGTEPDRSTKVSAMPVLHISQKPPRKAKSNPRTEKNSKSRSR